VEKFQNDADGSYPVMVLSLKAVGGGVTDITVIIMKVRMMINNDENNHDYLSSLLLSLLSLLLLS